MRLMDASYSLLEAMRASKTSEIKISDGITFRRDCWGADFYNGRNNQPLIYEDLTNRAIISEVIKSMQTQAEILRKSKESALVK